MAADVVGDQPDDEPQEGHEGSSSVAKSADGRGRRGCATRVRRAGDGAAGAVRAGAVGRQGVSALGAQVRGVPVAVTGWVLLLDAERLEVISSSFGGETDVRHAPTAAHRVLAAPRAVLLHRLRGSRRRTLCAWRSSPAPSLWCPHPRRPGRARDAPLLSRCKTMLPWLVAAENTPASFAAETTSSVPVVVDLWAPWCGPCRMIAPVLEDTAARHAGKVKVVRLTSTRSPRSALASMPARSRSWSSCATAARSTASSARFRGPRSKRAWLPFWPEPCRSRSCACPCSRARRVARAVWHRPSGADTAAAGWFGLLVEGGEHVPADGPAIIAPNHKSFLDAFFVGMATRRPVRFMAKTELFRRPFGGLLVRLGAFPVRRGASRCRRARDGAHDPGPRRSGRRLPGGHARAGTGRARRTASRCRPPGDRGGRAGRSHGHRRHRRHLWSGPPPKPRRQRVVFRHLSSPPHAPTPRGRGPSSSTVGCGRRSARSTPAAAPPPASSSSTLAALGFGAGLLARRRELPPAAPESSSRSGSVAVHDASGLAPRGCGVPGAAELLAAI